MSEGVKSAGSHRQAVAGCKWYVVCELEWAWIWSPASSSRMKRVLCECVCVKYWQPPAVAGMGTGEAHIANGKQWQDNPSPPTQHTHTHTHTRTHPCCTQHTGVHGPLSAGAKAAPYHPSPSFRAQAMAQAIAGRIGQK
eukprot:1161873-Pelagomonas_calceolata.AAC.9